MKKSTWIIYIVIAATSLTTFLLISNDSVIGFFRGLVSAFILDGLVIFWEGNRITLKDKTQRQWSEAMMWSGVCILLLFAVGFAITYTLPSDKVHTINVLNYSIALKLSELIVYIATSIIGVWIVVTLGVILYLRGKDPETQKEIERTLAAQDRETEELRAYKIANKFTSQELGTLKALELYRADLEAIGKYTPGEIVAMVGKAHEEIKRQHLVPISADSVGLKTYHADIENPSMPKR